MNQFKHLTRPDRYTVEAMLSNDHSQAEIARTLRVSPSVSLRKVGRTLKNDN